MIRRHPMSSSLRSTLHGALFSSLLLSAAPAMALQSLADFLAGARHHGAEGKLAALTSAQEEVEVRVALGRVLPSLSARGVYTRNQFESKLDLSEILGGAPGTSSIEPFVIQAANQLDAYFQLDVPIVDFAGWARVDAAQANARAAQHSAEEVLLGVEKQVARNYYQLIGAEALRAAALKTLQAAEQDVVLTRERQAGGVATGLDLDRATAEVERARQSLSDAELTLQLSRRMLHTLTGLLPEGEASAVADDLHEEEPLENWLGGSVEAIPAVASAVEQRRRNESNAVASKLALVPTLSASAQEHLTNAPGFIGRSSSWVVTATINWRADVTTFGTLRSQEIAAALARTREEAVRQRALDQVYESWVRVHSGLARSRAARAETQASRAAVARARDRYQQGAGTQLELVQAERDAFSAEVSRIQADAALSYARAALRLDSGKPLGGILQP